MWSGGETGIHAALKMLSLIRGVWVRIPPGPLLEIDSNPTVMKSKEILQVDAEGKKSPASKLLKIAVIAVGAAVVINLLA